MLYLRAQTESGKVFGHKVIQKIGGNNFKTHFQALGALSRHLRPDRDSNPTDFPILDRYYFGQVLTTIGDTVVPTFRHNSILFSVFMITVNHYIRLYIASTHNSGSLDRRFLAILFPLARRQERPNCVLRSLSDPRALFSAN